MIDPEAATKAVVMLEQLAAAAKSRAGVLREQLGEYARAEHARTNAGVTWRYPDLASVVLPITEQTAVVSDPDALLEWVARNQPDQVEHIERVRKAFVDYLINFSVCEDGRVLLDGEEIPGMAVRPGGVPLSLAIRVGKGAKQLFPQLADEALRQLAAGPLAPVLAIPEATDE